MAYKIVQLDRRFKGYNSFHYYVSIETPVNDRVSEFLEIRKWAWDTFGPGSERDYASYIPDILWGWHTEYSNLRIYFKGPKELNWFKLRFGV